MLFAGVSPTPSHKALLSTTIDTAKGNSIGYMTLDSIPRIVYLPND